MASAEERSKDQNSIREEIKGFRAKFQEYQKTCKTLWGWSQYDRNSPEFVALREAESEERQELTYLWGKLENAFRRLGVESSGIAYGRQFLIMDEALGERLFNNPIKGNALGMAVSLSIKAEGKIESVNLREFVIKDSEFHPQLGSGKCLNLFADGHYSEAVENSFKIVRDRLRELTGYETGAEAFGKGKLYIRGASAKNVDEDFQKGVQFLTMAVDRFRNEKAHFADAKITDKNRAKQYLELSNLIMFLLDEAEIQSI